MKHRTIRTRIVAGFATLLILVGSLAVVTFVLLRQVTTATRFLNRDALPGLDAMAEIQGEVGDIQIKVLRSLVENSADKRKEIQAQIVAAREAILKHMDEYEATISLAEDRKLFAELVTLRDRYVAERAKLFELLNSDRRDEAVLFNEKTVWPSYEAYQTMVSRLLKFNRGNAESAGATAETVVARTHWVTLSSSILVIVLGIAFATTTVRGLNRALSRVADAIADATSQVAGASSQVSASSQSLAEGASEQAASLEETSSSLEEMSSMTRRNAENATRANALAAQARSAAEKGAADVSSMMEAMSAIKASGDETAKIIKTIDEIAFQTNILALNAAVEAARAGEAGMGFAVVADEVRNLAQRCAQAARETSAKIENSLSSTNQGVEVSAKVSQVLSEIATVVRQVDELVGEVATASNEQSQGISQINIAVSQMDKVTQGSAANAEEGAAASEELRAQSATLAAQVKELMALVKGSAASVVGNLANPGLGDGLDQPAGKPMASIPARREAVRPVPPPSPAPSRGRSAGDPALATDTTRQTSLEAGFKDF